MGLKILRNCEHGTPFGVECPACIDLFVLAHYQKLKRDRKALLGAAKGLIAWAESEDGTSQADRPPDTEVKCLSGAHEAEDVTMTESLANCGALYLQRDGSSIRHPVWICKHCRSLYVEKTF